MECDKEDKEEKDSIVSDSCWEPQHRTSSRKWLTRDASYKLPRENASEMRVEYQVPKPDERAFQGIRRIQHRDRMLHTVVDEIIEEGRRPPPIEKYCTEYDSNYHYPGYDPNAKKERNTDLFLKHPLYTSEPVTLYKFILERQKGLVSIPGCTESKHPFRRTYKFTKEQTGGSSF